MGRSGKKKKNPAAPGSSAEAALKSQSVNVAVRDCGIPNCGQAGGEVSPVSGNPPLPRVEQFTAAFLHRAHELKEEGNRRFQSKDYQGALSHYEQALKLTPRNHPDRAVFHSNRAACLMQMKPVQYEAVVRECTLALEIHPKFSRALFRRARALEAAGKLELALHDAQAILQEEPNHQDALELAKKLRVCIRSREEAQRDMQEKTTSAATICYAGTSPAALGASVVRGTPGPAANRGPTLPAKPLPKKKGLKLEQTSPKPSSLDAKQEDAGTTSKFIKGTSSHPENRGVVSKTLSQRGALTPITLNGSMSVKNPDPHQGSSENKFLQSKSNKSCKLQPSQCRPLKLVYDHDIRLAQMPINCRFRDLREIVGKRFPSAKAVLIKYKDLDGDLITVTCTEELRLAELAAEAVLMREKDLPSGKVQGNDPDVSASAVPILRLHIVEVSIEQEPVLEEQEEGLDIQASDEVDENHEDSREAVREADTALESVVLAGNSLSNGSDRKRGKCENEEDGKEIEIDEWLLDFAHLFRTHIGVDADAHVDLHELGMEFCSEALEETVTSEAAQPLFEAAACKFQEVAALAFFNWGNVHMCAARKRIPLEEGNHTDVFCEQLHAAFDWAQSQYELAGTRYEQALCVKPDFYEGVLALGQESFESAKLRWSLAMANKVDLKVWDSSETIALFKQAEERMKVAVDLWEKLEERRLKEVSSSSCRRDGLKLEARSRQENSPELSEAETQEQLRAMRSQINLFWGNILFEHSQVDYKLGLSSWKTLLDAAVEKFELAGASSSDIEMVLKNHAANSASPLELKGSSVIICEHTNASQGTEKVEVNEKVPAVEINSVANTELFDGQESGSVLH
ncbi:hypothetical protein L7F22_067120 [Adiantum nelumboides]|nr:hypothetical protein [Adiantum nelumboides]